MSKPMKLIKTLDLDAEELYKALSYSEVQRLVKLINGRLPIWIQQDPILQCVDVKLTKEMWLVLWPHFISLSVDIIVVKDPGAVAQLSDAYQNFFHGQLSFYDNYNEFILAKQLSLIQYRPNYLAN